VGLAPYFTSKRQTKNPHGFSKIDEDKQLLKAIVVMSFYF